MQASPLDVPKAAWRQDEELEIFSDAVGQFFEKECVPHVPQWRKDGIVPMEIWKKAGEMGLLGASVPEEYGGAGGDFRHDLCFKTDILVDSGAGIWWRRRGNLLHR